MDKIWLIVKNHRIAIVLSIIAIAFYISDQDSFFIAILIYGWFLKLLNSDLIKGKIRQYLNIAIWTACAIMIVLTFYVNHYMPHGASYPTGDVVCEHDDRGRCVDEYKEDLSKLNIPDWAKFVRSSAGLCSIFGLFLAGAITSRKTENEVSDEK
jgi:hypothetical protein